MNERIRQLAEQAYDDLVNQTGNIVVFDEDFQQRFAELIVRECALVVHKKTGPKSALNVLEHFGVEE
jgi:hypothetical protein